MLMALFIIRILPTRIIEGRYLLLQLAAKHLGMDSGTIRINDQPAGHPAHTSLQPPVFKRAQIQYAVHGRLHAASAGRE